MRITIDHVTYYVATERALLDLLNAIEMLAAHRAA